MNYRTTVTAILLVVVLFCSAQVPQKFNYQAVVRDGQNGLIANQNVYFRMSILESSADGSPVYVESHTVPTNKLGLADMVIGDGSVTSGIFSGIPWGSNDYFLKVEVRLTGGSIFNHVGTSQLISVPYALYSGNISSPTRKFTIQENPGHPADSALFEVRNLQGQTVFAVYPEGTRVYVLDEDSKGKKGGFAVGGYSRTTKGITQEYMRITPDSIRMYVDESATKGKKGGFAVGGYSRTAKGSTDQYFLLKPDSAKFLMVSEDAEGGSNALSVVTRTKAGAPEDITGSNLFNLTRQNYFIGHRTGESITSGYGNCFFGFESGIKTTEGIGNIFIGERSGNENISGSFNSFIGYQTGFQNRSGFSNVAIGYAAGQENRDGWNNVFVGTDAGVNTEGSQNVFIGNTAGFNSFKAQNSIMIGNAAGQNADTSYANVFIGNASGMNNSGGVCNVFIGMHAGGENTRGLHNTFLGHESGSFNTESEKNTFLGAYAGQRNTDGNSNTFLGMNAGHYHEEGSNNVFVGTAAGLNNFTGTNNVFIGRGAGIGCEGGKDNVFIGYEAGAYETGDGKLYIDLFPHDPDGAMIYGEFYNKEVRINNKLGIGRHPENEALEVEGDAYKTSGTSSWDVTSDARVKTEIETIEGGLEKIMQLRPVTFKYTDEWRNANPGVKDREYYHFVAQEFAEVFPGSVHRGPEALEGESDKLLRMNSQPAQVVAIRAIQELAEQNQELAVKNDAMEEQFQRLDEKFRQQQALLDKLQEENETLKQTNHEILHFIKSQQKP